jgi:hypothetical protein
MSPIKKHEFLILTKWISSNLLLKKHGLQILINSQKSSQEGFPSIRFAMKSIHVRSLVGYDDGQEIPSKLNIPKKHILVIIE